MRLIAIACQYGVSEVNISVAQVVAGWLGQCHMPYALARMAAQVPAYTVLPHFQYCLYGQSYGATWQKTI
jgi:hypothetical protein